MNHICSDFFTARGFHKQISFVTVLRYIKKKRNTNENMLINCQYSNKDKKYRQVHEFVVAFYIWNFKMRREKKYCKHEWMEHCANVNAEMVMKTTAFAVCE